MDKQKKNQKQPDSAKARTQEESGNEMPTPTFDEGGPRPSPIESTTNDGVRIPIATNPAGKPDEHRDAEGTHTDATMPPRQEGDPKRNTM
jgi:hypothetical protein